MVQDEERSKNVILFGVKETGEEQVESTVTQLFSSIGEKPQVIECVRVAKQTDDGPPSPKSDKGFS